MVDYNLNRGNGNVRLFEAGEVFERLGDGRDERRHLGFAATGDAIASSVHAPAQPYTFFHMKGDIEELLAAFQHQLAVFRCSDAAVFSSWPLGACRYGWRDRRALSANCILIRLLRASCARRSTSPRLCSTACIAIRCASRAISASRSSPPSSATFHFVFDDAVTFERIQSAVDAFGDRLSCRISFLRRSIVAKRLEPASTPSCFMRSSSPRSAPCATTKWRSGRRRSSRNSNRSVAC